MRLDKVLYRLGSTSSFTRKSTLQASIACWKKNSKSDWNSRDDLGNAWIYYKHKKVWVLLLTHPKVLIHPYLGCIH